MVSTNVLDAKMSHCHGLKPFYLDRLGSGLRSNELDDGLTEVQGYIEAQCIGPIVIDGGTRTAGQTGQALPVNDNIRHPWRENDAARQVKLKDIVSV
jgi:hypothetical protein